MTVRENENVCAVSPHSSLPACRKQWQLKEPVSFVRAAKYVKQKQCRLYFILTLPHQSAKLKQHQCMNFMRIKNPEYCEKVNMESLKSTESYSII